LYFPKAFVPADVQEMNPKYPMQDAKMGGVVLHDYKGNAIRRARASLKNNGWSTYSVRLDSITRSEIEFAGGREQRSHLPNAEMP